MDSNPLLGIFLHPAATARSLAERPSWLTPVIIGMIVMALVTYLVYGISRVEAVEHMKDSSLAKLMPAGSMEKAEAEAHNITPGQHIFGGLVLPAAAFLLVQMLLYGAILHGMAHAMGGRGTFKQTFALLAHCRLINPSLAGLVGLPIVLAKQSIFGVSLSLAALVPALGPGSLLYGLLSMVSIFGVWFLVVIIPGIQEIHGIPRNYAIIAAGVPWLAGGLVQAIQLALI